MPFVYAGYVSGDYLDENVSNRRGGRSFRFRKSRDSDKSFHRDTLLNHSSGEAELPSGVLYHGVKIEKEERIKSFVQGKAPQYRPLLKHTKGGSGYD